MIERVDGSMHRHGAGGQGERHEPRPGARASSPADGGETAAPDGFDARLAAVIADVERLSIAQDAADMLPAADAHALAERMAGDAAGAIVAQAGLGPQGVRLVLGASPIAPTDALTGGPCDGPRDGPHDGPA